MGEQPEDDEQALMIYMRMVMQTTSSMPLCGVDMGASDATQSKNTIGLANIYVDLDTTLEQHRAKTDEEFQKHEDESATVRERYSVLDAAIDNKQNLMYNS